MIVTGSGASHELAVNGSIPMMTAWAAILRKDLDSRLDGLADAAGLVDGIDGPTFEEVIGEVLRWRSLSSLNSRFVRFGSKGVPLRGTETAVANWIQLAGQRGETFEDVLWTSLWREFGTDSLDRKKAKSAFGALIGAADISQTETVFATTNYDPAIQLALEELGWPTTDGFDRSSTLRAPALDPSRMVDWRSRNHGMVPILQLHGGVGWYVSSATGLVTVITPDQAFNPSLGVPAVIAPDPTKDPERDDAVGGIWVEFRKALADATHVFIVGHSLQDLPLVDAIKANRAAKVGVLSPTASKGLKTKLPAATAFDFSFGPQALSGAEQEELREWFSTT